MGRHDRATGHGARRSPGRAHRSFILLARRRRSEEQGARYAIKPKLGAVIGFVAAVLGKTPADYECVISTKDIPAFVRCDGPLRLKGRVYRFELTNPR